VSQEQLFSEVKNPKLAHQYEYSQFCSFFTATDSTNYFTMLKYSQKYTTPSARNRKQAAVVSDPSMTWFATSVK